MVVQAGEGHPRDERARQRLLAQGGVQFPIADLHHLLLAGVGVEGGGPAVEEISGLGVEPSGGSVGEAFQRRTGGVLVGAVGAVGREGLDGADLLELPSDHRLFGDLVVVGSDRLGHLGQVADP